MINNDSFQIEELKNQLEDLDAPSPQSANSILNTSIDEGPRIFQGNIKSIPRDEILVSLPSRDLVDGFVSVFFLQREHIPSKFFLIT